MGLDSSQNNADIERRRAEENAAPTSYYHTHPRNLKFEPDGLSSLDSTHTAFQPAHSVAMTVAYNGAPFAGFARQQGQQTVQGEIEYALKIIYRRIIGVTCAGRTDAGVHAFGQVVSFHLTEDEWESRTLESLARSVNSMTHPAIVVRDIKEKKLGFSARFDAQSREYRYYIYPHPNPPIIMRDFSWHVPQPLNLEAMREASTYLVGEHDFKSFCVTASAEGKNTVRNIELISFMHDQILGERVLSIRIVGNAFLHSMVRTVVGSLVLVGREKRSPEWMQEVLEACDRQAAGETAPAKGLMFWQVIY